MLRTAYLILFQVHLGFQGYLGKERLNCHSKIVQQDPKPFGFSIHIQISWPRKSQHPFLSMFEFFSLFQS